MIDALGIRSGGWASEREVPFEEVGFKGTGVEGWVGMRGEFGGFFQNAFYRWGFGVECRERHGGIEIIQKVSWSLVNHV